MTFLSTHSFDLSFEPEHGVFDLFDNRSDIQILRGARMLVSCRQQGQRRQYLSGDWQVDQESSATQHNSHHGTMQMLQLVVNSGPDSPWITVTFSLPEKYPFVLAKVCIENQTIEQIEIERIELLRVGGQSQLGEFRVGKDKSPKYSFYSNGWQSWSYTGTYFPEMAMRSTRLGFLVEPSMFNAGTPRTNTPGYFTADFFGAVCEQNARSGLLLGFLSQRQQFGTIEAVLYDLPSLRLWANGDNARLDPGSQLETDWAVIFPFSLDDPDPFGEYIRAVARENEIKVKDEIPTGWCSWYQYYEKITPSDVRKNLSSLIRLSDTLPLECLQLDDGFEAAAGDWFDFKPTFVEGVEPLAKEIKAAGRQPGLWLAPFILHPRAKLADQHPDWLLRNAKGRAVNCGFGWNALTRGLDLTVPEVLDYVRQVIGTAVHKWGFPYLKLDFLYAAAVKGCYNDATRTRAQVLRVGMEAVREAAGADTFIVGCGAPLGSMLGLVDSMRISEDASGDWYPHLFKIGLGIKNEPFMPSVRNAVHNSLVRSPLHKRWWINDPDCLLVRPDTNLSLSEVQTLASTIALTGGALLVSDDLTALPEDRRRLIEVLLPLIAARPQVLDLFDSTSPSRLRLDLDSPAGPWHLLAWLNWNDSPKPWRFDPQDFHLKPGEYLIRSFWDGKIHDTSSMKQLEYEQVPAHGTVVLAVREQTVGKPQYLGSDMHISQGIEVTKWKPSSKGLDLELGLPRRASGNIYLCLPHMPKQIVSDDMILAWTVISPGIIMIPITFIRKAFISILY